MKSSDGSNLKKPPTGKNRDRAYDEKTVETIEEFICCPAQLSGEAKDCPLGMLHPCNGKEFGMGCSLCSEEAHRKREEMQHGGKSTRKKKKK